MQLSNNPCFDTCDAEANDEAAEFLRGSCRAFNLASPEERQLHHGHAPPQLDRHLHDTAHPYHQELRAALESWGHVADGSRLDGGPAPDDVYFAPYANYRVAKKYQPLYRRLGTEGAVVRPVRGWSARHTRQRARSVNVAVAGDSAV